MKNKQKLIVRKNLFLFLFVIMSSIVVFQNHVIKSVTAAETDEVTIDETNFLKYFSMHHDATYSEDTKIVTLTQDLSYQKGNAALKTKIDVSEPFSFKGTINIGSKDQSKGGADGLAFVMHPGSPDDSGTNGNGFGIGGLPGAIGFKVDTYYNDSYEPKALADPDEFGYSNSFGAFIYTDEHNDVNSYKDATDPLSAPKLVENPNGDHFKTISIVYDGVGTLTVDYDGKKWQLNVKDKLDMKSESYTFTIFGSTGESSNLQQVKVDTFTYTPKYIGGTVLIQYVDDKGATLAKQDVLFGDVGESYTTSAKEFAKYHLSRVPSNATGKYSSIAQKVVYVYSKNQGSVIAKYVDESGNELLSPITSSGEVDTTYKTEAKPISNYTLKEVQGLSEGTYKEDNQTVTYVYSKNQGKVIAKYVDESGRELSSSVTLSGPVETPYTTAAKHITNYTLKEVKGSKEGTYQNEEQTVVYVYSRLKGQVIVEYVDEDGNLLANTISMTGDISSPYTTDAKEFTGYTLKEISGDENGFYANDTQTVRYVYRKSQLSSTGSSTTNRGLNTGIYSTNSSSSQKNLPQTGDNGRSTRLIIIFGILLIVVGWKIKLKQIRKGI